MSLLDLDAIPGYREACEREQEARNLAVSSQTVPLCGLSVYQLAPRHVCLLRLCQNAFFCGGRIQPEDVAFFLWVVSPEYSLDHKKRDKFLRRNVSALKYVDSVKQIKEYLDRAFMDAPPTGGDPGGAQYVAPVVFLIDLFASQYGWTDEKTMSTPLPALFQYMKAIRLRVNPRATMFNPSDGLKSKHLMDRMRGNN